MRAIHVRLRVAPVRGALAMVTMGTAPINIIEGVRQLDMSTRIQSYILHSDFFVLFFCYLISSDLSS